MKNAMKTEVNLLKLLSQSDGDNFDSYHTEYLDRYQNLIDKQIKTKNKFARIEYETRRVEDINRTLNNRLQYIIYLVVILILIIAIIISAILFIILLTFPFFLFLSSLLVLLV